MVELYIDDRHGVNYYKVTKTSSTYFERILEIMTKSYSSNRRTCTGFGEQIPDDVHQIRYYLIRKYRDRKEGIKYGEGS